MKTLIDIDNNILKEAISTLLDDKRVAISGPIMVELIQGARTEK